MEVLLKFITVFLSKQACKNEVCLSNDVMWDRWVLHLSHLTFFYQASGLNGMESSKVYNGDVLARCSLEGAVMCHDFSQTL